MLTSLDRQSILLTILRHARNPSFPEPFVGFVFWQLLDAGLPAAAFSDILLQNPDIARFAAPNRLPLHKAAMRGDVAIIHALLPFVDIQAVSDAGDDAIYACAASANGSAECIQALLGAWLAAAHPAAPPLLTRMPPESQHPPTALAAAIATHGDGAQGMVDLLIPFTDVHATNAPGSNAAMIAAEAGAPECLRKLLAAGANPRSRSILGQTPLMFAASAGRADCVNILLPLSDLAAKDDFGQAAEEGASKPIQAIFQQWRCGQEQRALDQACRDAPSAATPRL